MDLNTPISKASRAYKMYERRLEKLGITKLIDFLYHIPFRYENYSLVSKISEIQPGETITVKGKLEKIENVYTRKWTTFQKAIISDDTGILNVIWFNQPFLTRILKKSDLVSLSGMITLDKGKLVLQSPQYEVVFDSLTIHTGRLVPVYPETRGVSSKWLRRQVFNLLSQKKHLDEYLPEKIVKENNLMKLWEAIEQIHFPKDIESAQKARERLAFDELFNLQLSSLVRKKRWEKEQIKPWTIDIKKTNNLIKSLPFDLTPSQNNAVSEILKDLSSNTPMNRLLEGDVGSGKTIVSIFAIYIAYKNGFQTAFMTPTEILANQHYKTIKNMLEPLGVKIAILTGSRKDTDKKFDLLIGTHALVYKNAKFKNLGLIIIDEQQRFGVEQRAIIRKKGNKPHLLTMTATPIPRTVALTMYGDLDLSVLSDMPKGRRLIKTWLVPSFKRQGAYKWIEEKIKKGKDQVFIICPFIEESESMATVKAATKEFERLKKEVFPNLKLGLLHGKMKSKEKDKILKTFRAKKIDILVSTPVVEVGIDIPSATIMLIEEAERFGLAQLHQLRGRVGRSDKQSYCLLFTTSKNGSTIERLKSLETVYSGAELSEIDLKLRGPGQIYGTMQHGVPQLKIASFSDFELINKTKKEAKNVFNKISNFQALEKRINETLEKDVLPD